MAEDSPPVRCMERMAEKKYCMLKEPAVCNISWSLLPPPIEPAALPLFGLINFLCLPTGLGQEGGFDLLSRIVLIPFTA